MIQIYADGELAYDSRRENFDLMGLRINHGINVSGFAEIVMPPDHPSYNLFNPYKTIVTIFRDGKLRFRGRVRYTEDNFSKQRTVMCEGELSFLRDSIMPPFVFEGTPKDALGYLLAEHYRWLSEDTDKLFELGSVTVAAPNGSIRMEEDTAQPTLNAVNKLLDLCGGHFIIADSPASAYRPRTINWYATPVNESRQTIEFGKNLLDYKISGADSDSIITQLIPYGAVDEETKQRITVESVNGGMLRISDYDAIAIYGNIIGTATWDDISDPEKLLIQARAYLNEKKNIVRAMELTALDLSVLDKSIDSFSVGDYVHVISKPHGVDTILQVSSMSEDLLHPSLSRINLGTIIRSLTGKVAAETRINQVSIIGRITRTANTLEARISEIGATN